MEKTKADVLEEQLNKVIDFFKKIMDRGMDGKAGAEWPVIVRRWGNVGHEEGSNYVYQYPSTFFNNLKTTNNLHFSARTKADRLRILKVLVEKLIKEEIDIYLFHFGIFLLYARSFNNNHGDLEFLGKRRKEFILDLPRFQFLNNDDFISSVWSYLIYYKYPEVGKEIVRVPMLKDIRLLFTPDQFAAYTGRYYSNADWLEPIPGYELDVQKWTAEKDPISPQPTKEGMIEGNIILGHQGGNSGLRHFVGGQPVHAGSYIEVKFGDGWIPGRYEWSFVQGSPIQIHSFRDECFYIREGHLVRIRA